MLPRGILFSLTFLRNDKVFDQKAIFHLQHFRRCVLDEFLLTGFAKCTMGTLCMSVCGCLSVCAVFSTRTTAEGRIAYCDMHNLHYLFYEFRKHLLSFSSAKMCFPTASGRRFILHRSRENESFV